MFFSYVVSREQNCKNTPCMLQLRGILVRKEWKRLRDGDETASREDGENLQWFDSTQAIFTKH